MQPVLPQGISFAEFEKTYDYQLVKMGTVEFPDGYEPLSPENYGKFRQEEMLVGGMIAIRSCTESENGDMDCHLKKAISDSNNSSGQGYFTPYKAPEKSYEGVKNQSFGQFSLFGMNLDLKAIGIGAGVFVILMGLFGRKRK